MYVTPQVQEVSSLLSRSKVAHAHDHWSGFLSIYHSGVSIH